MLLLLLTISLVGGIEYSCSVNDKLYQIDLKYENRNYTINWIEYTEYGTTSINISSCVNVKYYDHTFIFNCINNTVQFTALVTSLWNEFSIGFPSDDKLTVKNQYNCIPTQPNIKFKCSKSNVKFAPLVFTFIVNNSTVWWMETNITTNTNFNKKTIDCLNSSYCKKIDNETQYVLQYNMESPDILATIISCVNNSCSKLSKQYSDCLHESIECYIAEKTLIKVIAVVNSPGKTITIKTESIRMVIPLCVNIHNITFICTQYNDASEIQIFINTSFYWEMMEIIIPANKSIKQFLIDHKSCSSHTTVKKYTNIIAYTIPPTKSTINIKYLIIIFIAGLIITICGITIMICIAIKAI
jgi:hypothetical protein